MPDMAPVKRSVRSCALMSLQELDIKIKCDTRTTCKMRTKFDLCKFGLYSHNTIMAFFMASMHRWIFMASMHSHLVPGVDPQACVQDTIGYRGAELVRVTLIYGLLSCELKLESVSGIERSKNHSVLD